MTYQYTPKGVCARQMLVTLEDDMIQEVQIVGGCHGNLQGICALVKGRKAQEVIDTLASIRCGGKPTSCPHQLTLALQAALTASAD